MEYAIMNDPTTSLPDQVAAIEGEFRERFDAGRIPVAAIRHVRQWGLQVDDEFEIPGHERTRVADEELWEISIRARDGSTYEVNAALLLPAPE
jgi:hypothetical protein